MSNLQKPATKEVVVNFKSQSGEGPFNQLPNGRPVRFDEFVPLDVIAYLSGVNSSSVWKVLLALHAIDTMTPHQPADMIRIDAVPLDRLDPTLPEHRPRMIAADKFVRRLADQPMFIEHFEKILFTGGRIRREVDSKGRPVNGDKKLVRP